MTVVLNCYRLRIYDSCPWGKFWEFSNCLMCSWHSIQGIFTDSYLRLETLKRHPNCVCASWGCGMWARMRSFNGDSRRSLLTKQIVGAIEQQGAWQLSNGTKEGKIIFNSSVNWGCGIVVLPSLTVRQRSRVGEVPAVGSVSYRLTT